MKNSTKMSLAAADKLSQALNRCAYMKLLAEKESSSIADDKAAAKKLSDKMAKIEKQIRTLLKKASAENLQHGTEIEKSLAKALNKLDSGIRKIEKTKSAAVRIILAAEHLDEILKLLANFAK